MLDQPPSAGSSTEANGADVFEHPVNCACAACSQADSFKDDVDRSQTPTDTGTTSAASVATLQQMADFLELGYWNNGTGLRHNLGSTGLDPNNGVLYYNVSGFGSLTYGGGEDANGVTAARAELIRDAFDVYSAVLGIQFIETTSTDDSVVDFFFSDNKSGAYAGSTRYNDGTIYYSYINLAESWSGGTSTYDDYTLQTIFHEIGHALGLGHQGPYNGSASYSTDAIYQLDSWQATMMSYFSQTQNSVVTADREFLQTPMAVDWLALDDIYGQFGYGVSNAFTGDTTYGFNTTITAGESRIWNDWSNWANRTASTIIDADGIDTLDVSGYSANQKIDLTIQRADQNYQDSSDIGGRIGNLTLGIGTVIENAIGGTGNDQLIGNTANNVLRGGGGDDDLRGDGGNDQLHGDDGFDTVLYDLAYNAYSFTALSSAIEVIGEGIDLVYNTVESFEFADVTYSYQDIFSLFSNALPVAVNDTATVAEGAPLSLDLLANDSDADADALSITQINGTAVAPGESVGLSSGAVVTLNGDGTVSYDQAGAFDALLTGQTGSDSFTYTVSDGNGGTATATAAVSITGDTGDTGAIGQSGTVSVAQASRAQWHSVSFDEAIENAVVVLGPVSQNDTEQVTTRVRNVTDTGFEFQIDEWTYLDGVHGTETLSWLAVSAGAHRLANGQSIVAGTQSVGTGLSNVAFGPTLGEAVVMAEVTSVNEADAVTTRIRDVSATGFQVQLQEEEALGAHVPETVSWIAMETGSAAGIDVVRTGNRLDNTPESFSFNTSFSAAPVLLADMQSRNGGDTGTVRLNALDANAVSLFIEEEQSASEEVVHINEIGGYIALSGGLLYAGADVAPDAVDDTASVVEGRVLTLDVLANDTDANLDTLTITMVAGQAISVGGSVTLASGAVVTLNANGTLTYDQAGVFAGLATGQTLPDGFSYTVADGNGGTDTAQVALTVEGQNDPLAGVIGQAGTVSVAQTGPDQWHSVTFDAAISNAAVVLGPISTNDTEAATTRVRNVTDTGFEFQIDEWGYLDGVHAAESISWLAISEGTHELASGRTIKAGSQDVGTSFTDVTFDTALADAVVLAEAVTVNEADAVATRLQNVTGAGFQVKLEEEEALGAHVAETVSWIAFERGAANGLEVVRTPDRVTDSAETFMFTEGFTDAPVLLADMQTYDGGDTATVRSSALDATAVALLAQEEQSRDDEVTHTTEVLGFVAVEDGLIYWDSL